jgi:hypothetical protein
LLISWIAGSTLLFSCGAKNFDVDNATDREAMKIEVRTALSRGECTKAVSISARLYDSKYTDNPIRLLHASALGCVTGIRVLDNVDQFSSFGGVNSLGQFARIYPSVLYDQKLESAWLAQDALMAMLNPGAVVGPADQVNSSTLNPGSVLIGDRTQDSNVYLLFVSMATIGNTLYRYGTPDASYNQGTDIPWTSRALVQSDLSGSACGLAAGFLSFFDSFRVVKNLLPSSTASALDSFIGAIEDPIANTMAPANGGGLRECLADGYSQLVCDQVKTRLRYRKACSEHGAAASFAAGMIKSINLIWQP